MLLPNCEGFRAKLVIPIFDGFLLRDEIFADNRKNYEQILRTESHFSREYRRALWDLEVLEKFPPGIKHDRVVAHRINAYEIQEPQWVEISTNKIKRWREAPKKVFEHTLHTVTHQLIPQGPGRRVLSTDLGEALKEESFAGNEYIDIRFELDRNFSRYTFFMKAGEMGRDKPLEFHIRQYIAINGTEIDEVQQHTIVASPMFSINPLEPNRVERMFGFEYRRQRIRHLGE
mgnify:CR=1 FL=1